MILSDEYFHDSVVNYNFKPTPFDYERCDDLLARANKLLEDFGEDRGLRSGHRTREQTEALQKAGYRAAAGGNNEKSLAVDIADPDNTLDAWLDDAKLEGYGLWRQAPEATA